MSFRLLFAFIVALLLSLVLSSGYWLSQKQTSETIKELSRHELGILAESIRNNIVTLMRNGASKDKLDQTYRALQNQQSDILDLHVIHGDLITNQFADHSSQKPQDEFERQSLLADSSVILEQGETGKEKLRFIYPLKAEEACMQCHLGKPGDNLGALSLTMNARFVYQKINEHQRTQICIFLVEGLILLLILAAVVNQLVFRPLLRLDSGFKKLETGDFSQKIGHAFGNEMGNLFSNFNKMSAQVQSLMQKQDNLISEQALDLAGMVEISHLMGSSFSELEVLNQFAKSLTDSAKVTWCRIAVLKIDPQRLDIDAIYSVRNISEDEKLIASLKENQYPKMQELMQAKQHAIIQREEALSPDETRLLFSGQETNVLCIPIVHKNNVSGIVFFGEFRSKDRDPLDDRKIYLCRAMVNLIGSAIEIGRLFTRLLKQSDEVVLAMAEAVEKKSPWTAGHSKRVTEYALSIAKALGWSKTQLEELSVMGLLHDIGKIGMPGMILNKTSKLTEEEYAMVKRHPEDGAQILSRMHTFLPYIPAIRHHHEWFDGQGYPDGLCGEAIPLSARILAVADAFDAMTADRPYRKGLTPEDAMKRLQQSSGQQFDPEIVDVFKLAYHQ